VKDRWFGQSGGSSGCPNFLLSRTGPPLGKKEKRTGGVNEQNNSELPRRRPRRRQNPRGGGDGGGQGKELRYETGEPGPWQNGLGKGIPQKKKKELSIHRPGRLGVNPRKINSSQKARLDSLRLKTRIETRAITSGGSQTGDRNFFHEYLRKA